MSTTAERTISLAALGLGAATEAVVRAASAAGFSTAASGPGAYRLARTRRPLWAKVGAVVAFPIAGLGLLFLLVKRTESGTVTVFEDREGVKLRLVGAVDASIFTPLATVAPPGQPTPVGAAGTASWAPAGVSTIPGLPLPAVAVGAMVSAVPGGVADQAPAPSVYRPSNGPVDETMLRAPLQPPLQPASQLAPPQPGVAPAAPLGEVDVERTIARSALMVTPAGAVRLIGPAGFVIEVGRGVVLGRHPEPDGTAPHAAPVALADQSLSKTHATVSPTLSGVIVVDHHSTNGTMISLNGQSRAAAPGTPVDVPAGAVLVLGELQLRVEVA